MFQNMTQILKNKLFFLMISNGEKGWHYLAAKKLSATLKGITSKHGDFYSLNCFHSFATKNKLQSHKRVCEIKIFVTL